MSKIVFVITVLLTLTASALSAASCIGQCPGDPPTPMERYIGVACRALHDPPVNAFSYIGPQDDGSLTLRCGRHAYRSKWVVDDGR